MTTKKTTILFFMLLAPWITSVHAENQHTERFYQPYIAKEALKPYTTTSKQYTFIKKFKAKLHTVNQQRKQAAYLSLDSGKCDFVKTVDIVADNGLSYEVICRNNAIIYLTSADLNNNSKTAQERVIPEKDKALPLKTALSRCETLVNQFIKNKGFDPQTINLDQYKTATLITVLGETIINMYFELQHHLYKARCIFNQGQESSFSVKRH